MTDNSALVVLSGGQDSATCLYWARECFSRISAITFDYGQRHNRELDAAIYLANKVGVTRHHFIGMDGILASTSPLVSDSELEQYADHASLPGGIEKTFVPMRNQLFLTVAANRAVADRCTNIVTGVCQEDYGGYPDCRRVFIDALEQAINLGTFDFDPDKDFAREFIKIHTPLMNLTKADTVRLAMSIPGAYAALAHTHTAYDGQYPPTGKDHASLLRAKGFEEAGVPDPLVLRAVTEGSMPMPETPNYSDDKVKDALAIMMSAS